jgi:hypothetical protein
MDASWRVLRDEVPHLERKPSEYFGEHFWFSTQPCAEPENPADFNGLYEQFTAVFHDHLVFATDYPHWDMDSPFDATPALLPFEEKRKILGANAAALYGIEIDARVAV